MRRTIFRAPASTDPAGPAIIDPEALDNLRAHPGRMIAAFGTILAPHLQHRIGEHLFPGPTLPEAPRPNSNRAKQQAQRAARKRNRKA